MDVRRQYKTEKKTSGSNDSKKKNGEREKRENRPSLFSGWIVCNHETNSDRRTDLLNGIIFSIFHIMSFWSISRTRVVYLRQLWWSLPCIECVMTMRYVVQVCQWKWAQRTSMYIFAADYCLRLSISDSVVSMNSRWKEQMKDENSHHGTARSVSSTENVCWFNSQTNWNTLN